MSDIESKPIIIDTGSYEMKCGYAGDMDPRYVCRTLSAKADEILEDTQKISYEQDNTQQTYQYGIVQDIDQHKQYMLQCLQQGLRTDISNRTFMLTECLNTPKQTREKVCQLMFDDLHCKRLHIQTQPQLAMYSVGSLDGIVLDVGYQKSSACVVLDGMSQQECSCTSSVGGRLIDQLLYSHYNKQNYNLQMQDVINIKEKYCAFLQNDELAKEQIIELPNSTQIVLNNERFTIPNVLFSCQNSCWNNSDYSLQQLVYNSAKKCKQNENSQLTENIILTGGSTLFSNFQTELQTELNQIISKKCKTGYPVRYASFAGASILASLPCCEQQYISVQEYQENGSVMVVRKCW